MDKMDILYRLIIIALAKNHEMMMDAVKKAKTQQEIDAMTVSATMLNISFQLVDDIYSSLKSRDMAATVLKTNKINDIAGGTNGHI